MPAGNRCSVYELIDGLSGARSLEGLVALLQPILAELAYSAVEGEAAILDAHEDWRSSYADRLYEASAKDYVDKQREAAAAFDAKAKPAPGDLGRARREGAHREKRPAGGYPDQPRPDQPRPDQPRPDQPRPDQPRPDQPRPDRPREKKPVPPPSRPRADRIPASLLAIMEGTHPSLGREED